MRRIFGPEAGRIVRLAGMLTPERSCSKVLGCSGTQFLDEAKRFAEQAVASPHSKGAGATGFHIWPSGLLYRARTI